MTLLISLCLVLVAFLIYTAAKSSHYEISRSVLINAPADKIFPYLCTRKIANSWNPFLQQDPNVKITLSGPEAGVGSKTSWDSQTKLGTGSAEVVESVPSDHLLVNLDIQKPMAMKQVASYWLAPAGSQTKVTWKVAGENTFIARLFCTFMNPDKMVGGTFLQGLNQLKSMVEGAPRN